MSLSMGSMLAHTSAPASTVAERPSSRRSAEKPLPTEPFAYVTATEVLRLWRFTRKTLQRHIAAGKFPAPDRTLPGGMRLWRWSTVKSWLEQ